MIRRACLALIATMVSACGTGGASLASPSPTPTRATASASASAASPAPSLLPGSSVRITVNGVDVQSGATVTLLGGPTTVRLVFPVDMDRSTVDPLLPRSATVTWTGDRTVTLLIPANEGNPAFKVAGATSKDGRTTFDFFVVNMANPPSMVLSTFTVSELVARAQPPKPDAPRVPATRGIVIPASDSKQILSAVFGDPPINSFARVVDLSNGRVQTLTLPAGTLTLGGWVGTDRIIVVTDRVWSVPVDGGPPKAIADLASLGVPTMAAVSTQGTYLAVASKDRVVVVTLATGALRSLTSVALSCDGRQNVAGLAWSADETRLGVSDCVAASSTQYRTRILEPATGATVAVVSGGTYGIRSLLTGDLIVSSEPTQSGEGARPRWVIYSFSGVEKARLLGYAPTLSPDGRYVLDSTCCAGEGFTLAPLGTEPDRATMGSAIWLPDGRVLVLTR